jgi:hypothetical protein
VGAVDVVSGATEAGRNANEGSGACAVVVVAPPRPRYPPRPRRWRGGRLGPAAGGTSTVDMTTEDCGESVFA